MRHRESVSRGAHERPTIVLRPGKFPDAVDRAEDALLGRCEKLRIFRRGGQLVRVISLPERHEDGRLRRPRGSVQLEPVSSTALTEVFNRIAKWRRKNSSGTVVDYPPTIAGFYTSRTGFWRVPVLRGIISAPILRADGSVLDKSGYDAATGLYLSSGEDWSRIPEQPTRADAEAASETLLAPFAEFPFVTAQDRETGNPCWTNP